MILNTELVLTEIGTDYVAVPVGENKKNVIIRLNETGAYICKKLAEGFNEKQIIDMIMNEYADADRDAAERSVRNVIEKLKSENLLED